MSAFMTSISALYKDFRYQFASDEEFVNMIRRKILLNVTVDDIPEELRLKVKKGEELMMNEESKMCNERGYEVQNTGVANYMSQGESNIVAPKEPNLTEALDEMLKRLYEIRDEMEQAHEKLGCFTLRLERNYTESSCENIPTIPNIFTKIDLIKRELTFMYNMAINIRKRV